MTSDFRYQMKLPEGSMAGIPYDGNYNGYFWMKMVPPKRVVDNNLSLKFIKDGDVYLVEGQGQNKLGAFSVTGIYNPQTSTMECDKNYQSPGSLRKGKSKPKPKPKPRARSSEEHLYSQSSHSRIPIVMAQVGINGVTGNEHESDCMSMLVIQYYPLL